MFRYPRRVLPVFPTRRGIVVMLVALVLYALAWLTNIGWFFVADALAWSALVVNLLVPWFNLRGLSAERSVVVASSRTAGSQAGLAEDAETDLIVDIKNRSYLPKVLVTIRERCPLASPDASDSGFFIGSASPRSTVRALYRVRCYLRGSYEFPDLEAATSAPFGLFSARRSLNAPLHVTVYPKVVSMDATARQGALTGQMPQSILPRPTGEFRGVREYQPGDRINSIHWKSSARSGHLMIREFDEIPEGEIRVALNPACLLGEGKENTLEYGVKIVASLADSSYRRGLPFKMWPATWELSSLEAVMRRLALLREHDGDGVRELLGQPRSFGASVIVLSSGDEETLRLLYRQPSSVATTVMLLEGFGTGEDADAMGRLSSMGFTMVGCKKGELSDALFALSKVLARGSSGVDRPRDTEVREASGKGAQNSHAR